MNDRQIARVFARLDALERREGLLAAVFRETATGTEDVLTVTIPAYDDGEHAHGDPEGVVWAPRVDDSGDPVYPSAGDEAWVQEANDGRWVVVGWTPS